MVAAALNEQGFMFAQVVRDTVRFGVGGTGRPNEKWRSLTTELPVTASDQSQTRVDLILKHNTAQGVYLCVECKRANPLYKQWVFFDKTTQDPAAQWYFEYFQASRRPTVSAGDAVHAIQQAPKRSGCEIFNLYLEVAVKRDGKSGHTQTIEDAFLQVTKGQSGLMAKLVRFINEFVIKAIPVVVTTAELFEARFDIHKVPLASGEIDSKHLKLVPLEFCAVNYHPEDAVTTKSPHVIEANNLESDILKHTRTVFVVQSQSVIKFLDWLAANVG
jgi:hypothetical protein